MNINSGISVSRYFQVFVLLVFSFYSCITLKLEIPEEPDEIIDFIVILNSVDESPDFSKSLKDNKVSTKDEKIYSLIKVLNISSKRSLIWFWYDPDKKLVKRSYSSLINKDGKYLEYFIAWDDISNDLFSKKKGKWNVVIKLNGKFLGRKEFVIK